MLRKAGLLVLFLGITALAGCAGTGARSGAPGEEGQGGTGTSGLPDRAGPQGGALAGDAKDLLAKKRVHFAFDSSSLDEENRAIVEAHSAHLVANPQLKVHLEGHGDERGTREYNLALGERRAQSVEKLMRVLGVQPNRITTASYGEEKPLSPEHNETAWAQNRRVEISYK